MPYEVQPGNTLEDYSYQFFDDSSYWQQILGLNPKIRNPELIYPGQRLRSTAAARPLRAKAASQGHRAFPADQTERLLRIEAQLDAASMPEDYEPRYRPVARRPKPTWTLSTAAPVRPQVRRQYPQLWLFPADIRIIATMTSRDDSRLYRVNDGQLKLGRSGEVSAKPFCLIRPMARQIETESGSEEQESRQLVQIVAKYFPYDDPLAQPFRVISRQLEAKAGDLLSASCPPSLAAIRSDANYDSERSDGLTIPREEVNIYHPEQRRFILPGQDALWRLKSGALPSSVRYLKLYRRAKESQSPVPMATVEVLQRDGQNLIVRYLSLSNTTF